MKKLSVFILILYVVLFCLVGCWDNDPNIYVGFGYGPDISEIDYAGMAGVYNQTEALNRNDFKIKLSYGWQERNKISNLFTDDEYISNSVVKLVVLPSEDFEPFSGDVILVWDNVFEIKVIEAKEFFTDKYRIDLKDVFGGITLDFRHSEDILIPSQILDVDYEIEIDYKGRNVRWNFFVLALLLIHTDADTNSEHINHIGFMKITTKEYEDGRLFINHCNT